MMPVNLKYVVPLDFDITNDLKFAAFTTITLLPLLLIIYDLLQLVLLLSPISFSLNHFYKQK